MSQGGIEADRVLWNNGATVCKKQDRSREGLSCGLELEPEVAFCEGQEQKQQNTMRTIKTLAIGLAAAALMCATSARASLITTGEPVEIGSWSQGFNESGVGNFTQVETIFRSGLGGGFESPGYTGLDAGWALGLDSANHVVAVGPARNNMTWNINFLGASSLPLVFDFYAWNGNVLAEKVRASWNQGWTFSVAAADPLLAPTPVPEPTTVIAGALLLLPFGMSTLRMLRKNRKA